MKIEITHYDDGHILFAHETENNSHKLTIETAISEGVNLEGVNLEGVNLEGVNLRGVNLEGAYLRGAYLEGAYLEGVNLRGVNLRGAYLRGAYLRGAYLRGVNLRGAYLEGVNLEGAYLEGAYLEGAYLEGAYLEGAYLEGAKLVGERPIFQIGPIGSRCAYFVAYITDKGLRFDAGCQRQITRELFEKRLKKEHGDNTHAKEYRAALALIDIHAEIWGTK